MFNFILLVYWHDSFPDNPSLDKTLLAYCSKTNLAHFHVLQRADLSISNQNLKDCYFCNITRNQSCWRIAQILYSAITFLTRRRTSSYLRRKDTDIYEGFMFNQPTKRTLWQSCLISLSLSYFVLFTSQHSAHVMKLWPAGSFGRK